MRRLSFLDAIRSAAAPFLIGVGLLLTPIVHAESGLRFDLPEQEATTAIPEFARQAGLQIIAPLDHLKGIRTHSVVGSMDAHEALRRLLQGTGLVISSDDGHTISLRLSNKSPTKADPPTAASRDNSADELTEVVVTAQKRHERLLDVPVPVTALNADTLADRDQSRLQDYFASVPGLSLNQSGSGRQTLAIRGIVTSTSQNPTVGVTIDDVPVGSGSLLGNGQLLPTDLDPSDLEQIEVLKGPQGTLYGADSLGGLIKYVTKDPSTDKLSGRVQVLGDDIAHGEPGYAVRGAINVPVSDNFALRMSGFARRSGGYVDNVYDGQRDVNRVNAYGGHLAALWQFSDAISLKLSALEQYSKADGNSAVDADAQLHPTLGDLKQSSVTNTEGYTATQSLYSATLTAHLGGADFTSVSGYGIHRYWEIRDGTDGLSGLGSLVDIDIPTGAFTNDFKTRKFSQEFRFSSVNGGKLDWIAGAFYTHENTSGDQIGAAVDPTTGLGVAKLIEFNFPSSLSDLAAFGDLTVHFTDRFDVQFGGRESHTKQVYNEVDSGPLWYLFYGPPVPFVNVTERVNSNAFTYLLTPRFKISPDLMVYVRLASGYRVGGVNVNAVLSNIPVQYKPDKTNNYEVGMKGDVWGHFLTFDASVYHIDWKQIQITLNDPIVGGYIGNGGKAKSEGIELSLESHPIVGMRVGLTTSYSDAQLTQNIDKISTAYGLDGDRLPYSSRFSGSLSLDQDFPLTGNVTGFVGGSASYVGSRLGEFGRLSTTPRLYFPGYADFDLRAGARCDGWTFNLFVNNLADKRGVMGGNTSTSFLAATSSPNFVIYTQPRTAGLSVTRTF